MLLNKPFRIDYIVQQLGEAVNPEVRMNTEKNILLAFILNLSFAVFEFVGGILTGSVAIVSDAVHDIGDAASIGIAFFLEKRSKKQPDETHTYGYSRYSVLGGAITTLILLLGSAVVIYNAVRRIIHPTAIHYDGMILFAIIGAAVNLCAAYFTRKGDSVNQQAVNLHMLEDVLGWVVVLVGAVVMRFTDLTILDPLMSIGVALFILINAVGHLKIILNLFLEKTPDGITVNELCQHVGEIDGVLGVHHVHIRSIDGHNHYATMHVVTDDDPATIKAAVRQELLEHGIRHVTLELENSAEECPSKECHVHHGESGHHHHHHSHHH